MQTMSLQNPSTIKHGALRQLRQTLPAGGVGRHINGYILTAHPDAVAACKGRLLTELKHIFQSAKQELNQLVNQMATLVNQLVTLHEQHHLPFMIGEGFLVLRHDEVLSSERTVLKVLRLRGCRRFVERWFAVATKPDIPVKIDVAKEDRRFVVGATPGVHRASHLPLSNKQTQLKPKRRQKLYRRKHQRYRRKHQRYRHRQNAQPRMLRW